MISCSPTGIEMDEVASSPKRSIGNDVSLPSPHFRLVQVILRDQTDSHNELVQENEWLLQAIGGELRLQGNAFSLESVLDRTGWVFLKLAPLPLMRPVRSEWDLCVRRGSTIHLQREDGYEWVILPYQDGRNGRILALHHWQRMRRPYNPQKDGLLLSNTWGDRSRDAHLSPDFMKREIESASRLGVDIVQIDDGWQRGITANSNRSAEGGVWNGFWAANPNFWGENRQRFPEGLAPLIAIARTKGIKFGLWFAPDSSHDAANWRQDADVVLKIHRELGVDFFKIDGLKMDSSRGEQNLRAFFQAVTEESGDSVTFDLDITAETRFGYFGLVGTGPLFIQNRYTDWHNYWPHQTLRAAWRLMHWIDPLRLRLEWLNHIRNSEQYADDPLAPHRWRPDALFATVMFCSPLGWFEVQNLPSSYFEEAAPLIQTWKGHRESISRGAILPVGEPPDGVAWTGFVSINAARTGGYALIFRELNPATTWELEIPLICHSTLSKYYCEVLGGNGTASLQNGRLKVEVPRPLHFIWLKFESL